MTVKPSWHYADCERDRLHSNPPARKSYSKEASHLQEKKLREHASHYNKARNPVKTSPPPFAINLDSFHLRERIESLQDLALVGRWHFLEMDDVVMRKWLEKRWIPLIDYTPIISILMKEWYCFHFMKACDLEIVLKGPWVYKRSLLVLYRWYIGFHLLKNTPSNSLIWVKLPNLPLEMWSLETLAEIGNSIGRFVYADPWCL